MKKWISEIEALSEFAKTEHQAMYSCFTHGRVEGKLNYFLRAIPDLSDKLNLLDETINLKLLPVMLGRNSISENECKLLSLSPKPQSLGLPIFSTTCVHEYDNSRRLTSLSINNIHEQKKEFDVDLNQLKKTRSHSQREPKEERINIEPTQTVND